MALSIAIALTAATPSVVPIKLVRVVDGDTIRVDLPCDLPIVCHNQPVRLRGIDTPELRSKCAAERELAQSARAALQAMLENAHLRLSDIDRDKYGRLLAHVFADDLNVGAKMLSAGLARAYGGDRRKGWCLG